MKTETDHPLPTLPPLVLYHADCSDGFAAALVARAAILGNPDSSPIDPNLVPVQYGDPVPLLEAADRDVWVVDFSWPATDLAELRLAARGLWIFDHHKGARAELERAEALGLGEIHFDPKRSGARIVWDYALDRGFLDAMVIEHLGWIVDYTEDRDLWTWELPDSREVSAFLQSLPREGGAGISTWMHAALGGFEKAAHLGAAIERYRRREIDSAKERAKVHTVELKAGTWDVPVVNVSGRIVSEVVGELSEGHAFAAGWWVIEDGTVVVSLRSRSSIDLSAIAALEGGGGHPPAAGFSIPSIAHLHCLGVPPFHGLREYERIGCND